MIYGKQYFEVGEIEYKYDFRKTCDKMRPNLWYQFPEECYSGFFNLSRLDSKNRDYKLEVKKERRMVYVRKLGGE